MQRERQLMLAELQKKSGADDRSDAHWPQWENFDCNALPYRIDEFVCVQALAVQKLVCALLINQSNDCMPVQKGPARRAARTLRRGHQSLPDHGRNRMILSSLMSWVLMFDIGAAPLMPTCSGDVAKWVRH